MYGVSKSKKWWRYALNTFLSVVFITLTLIIWTQRTAIQDWITVQRYSPPSSIEIISNTLDLTDKGRFTFYAATPEVSDADVFNGQCPRREQTNAILGCYSAGRIYIFSVDNPELDGIEEVTAAHELLHAAWDRLSHAEKERLKPLLEEAYEAHKTAELESRRAYYQRTEPDEWVNELHSIIATEFTVTNPALEAYYQAYFRDRQKIVGFHQSYSTVFANLQQEAIALETELGTLAQSVNQETESYNQSITTLNQRILAHNQTQTTLDRTNGQAVSDYNATYYQLVAAQQALQATRTSIEAKRAEYTQKLTRYNSLVLRSSELSNSLDSLVKQPQL